MLRDANSVDLSSKLMKIHLLSLGGNTIMERNSCSKHLPNSFGALFLNLACLPCVFIWNDFKMQTI